MEDIRRICNLMVDLSKFTVKSYLSKPKKKKKKIIY